MNAFRSWSVRRKAPEKAWAHSLMFDFYPNAWGNNSQFDGENFPAGLKLEIINYLVILCDLFGMVKWPFSMVKRPPTRGWKGHFESLGSCSYDFSSIKARINTQQTKALLGWHWANLKMEFQLGTLFLKSMTPLSPAISTGSFQTQLMVFTPWPETNIRFEFSFPPEIRAGGVLFVLFHDCWRKMVGTTKCIPF